MAKKQHEVLLPITGVAYVTVVMDAEATEDEIIEAALSECNAKDLETWEPHRAIVRGNVCYAEHREAEIVESEDVGESEGE